MNPQEEPIDPQVLEMITKLESVPERDRELAKESRASFLAEARSLAGVAETSRRGILGWLGIRQGFATNHKARRAAPSSRLSTVPLALVVVVGMILLFGGTGATVYAAQEALPGDTLYPLKNASEDARLTLTADPGDEAFLHLDFARRRLDEISGLIDRDRFGNITIATGQFERHILRAIAAISEVARTDPARSETLALFISQTLSGYGGEISRMAGAVPLDDSRYSLEQALRTSRLTVTITEVEFTALVDSQDPDRWLIGGLEIFIDEDTVINDSIQPGNLVQVHASVSPEGNLVAREIELSVEGDEPDLELTGLVELILPDIWMIGGQEFLVTPETEIDRAIAIGDSVEVKANQAQDGSLIAKEIKALVGQVGQELEEQPEEFSGTIETMDGEYWKIGETLVLVPPGTEIEGAVKPGDLVKVKVKIDAQGNLVALKIELENSPQNLSNDDAINPTAEPTEGLNEIENEQEFEDDGSSGGEDNSDPGNSEDEKEKDNSGPGGGDHGGDKEDDGSPRDGGDD